MRGFFDVSRETFEVPCGCFKFFDHDPKTKANTL
jgi:hypothetical protein